MEVSYCCKCFHEIIRPYPGRHKCNKCGHEYVFWASFERNGWGVRATDPIKHLPQELVEILKQKGWI